MRYSIKECNISIPNSKIMEEIIKTFINSRPGPKSIVTWSRSDKELVAGKITYEKGHIIISKDNRGAKMNLETIELTKQNKIAVIKLNRPKIIECS